jgi:aspartyl/asparaginyl-tRNA synthetase
MDLRRPVNNVLFQIETTAEMAMREYWMKNSFIEVHSPKLTAVPAKAGLNYSHWIILNKRHTWLNHHSFINRWPWQPG